MTALGSSKTPYSRVEQKGIKKADVSQGFTGLIKQMGLRPTCLHIS